MIDLTKISVDQLKEPAFVATVEREVVALERADARLDAEPLALWLASNRQATPRELKSLRLRITLVALPLLSSEEVRNFLRAEGVALAPYKDRIKIRLELWGAGREEGVSQELLLELDLALKQKQSLPPSSVAVPKSQTPSTKSQTNSKFQIPKPTLKVSSPPQLRTLSALPSPRVVPPSATSSAKPRIVPPPAPPTTPPKSETINPKPYSNQKPEIRITPPLVPLIKFMPPAATPKVLPPVLRPSPLPPTPPPVIAKSEALKQSLTRTIPVRTVATGKPRVTDIAPPPRLVSPSDELARLDPEAFRKLGETKRATNRISEMIDLLGRDSFARRLEGIRAWRRSPLYQSYLQVGQEALRQGGGLTATVATGTLTEAEFHAISDLNNSLRH